MKVGRDFLLEDKEDFVVPAKATGGGEAEGDFNGASAADTNDTGVARLQQSIKTTVNNTYQPPTSMANDSERGRA